MEFEICTEMLEQRKYTIIDKDDDRILAVKPDGKEMCVFFTLLSKFNVKSIQDFILMMKEMDVLHCIIVYKDKITPIAKQVIDECEFNIELFHIDELQYNITKHYLVPNHEVAYRAGTPGYIEFKKKYSDKFPVLLKSDVICRFYAYNKGDIIKITRKNGYVTFRIVK
jgi:DNA-directed RNA polymerase I, II, and III subunit RPABC1